MSNKIIGASQEFNKYMYFMIQCAGRKNMDWVMQSYLNRDILNPYILLVYMASNFLAIKVVSLYKT